MKMLALRSRFCISALFSLSFSLLLLCACSSSHDKDSVAGSPYYEEVKDIEMPEEVKMAYAESATMLDELNMAVKTYNLTHSESDFARLYDLYQSLDFSYESGEMDLDASHFCAEHKFRVDSVRFVAKGLLDAGVSSIRETLVSENDHLMQETTSYPFYLSKGTTLYIDYETDGVMNVRLYNADSYSTLRSWKAKKSVSDSLVVANGAVYVLEMSPKAAQYVNVELKKNCSDLDNYRKEYEIKEETVESKKGAADAKKIETISINSVFEEPRKVTLRSQGKAFFSGGSRSLVAMQVPASCTDILYSLRISTSQSDVSADGQFCNKVTEKYRQIKFLGLPLYESHKTRSNIFRELLNASEPAREEEAYCNLYVFTDSKQAKRFSDGAAVSELKYNVDLSKQGTQSCNDRISTNGMKTIYFGFENTRMRYSVYLWLESVATVKKTEYVKTKYVRAD